MIFLWMLGSLGIVLANGFTDSITIFAILVPVAIFGTIYIYFQNTTSAIALNRETMYLQNPPQEDQVVEIAVETIQQLFVARKMIERGGHYTKITYHYNLCALTSDHTTPKTLGTFEDVEQALFSEQKIEDYFNVRDVSITGDYH